jgi:hypothetical protein
MRDWAQAEAEATQTPADLPAVLEVTNAGAALAKKFRIRVRPGWEEPMNLFAAVAQLPGERKSTVFGDAIRPVQAYEQEEIERMAPVVAATASEHRMLEARLKNAELKAAKVQSPEERQRLRHEAKQLAKEFAAHVVPDPPQMFCDDVTSEYLATLLAHQGGRMLLASAEGTATQGATAYQESADDPDDGKTPADRCEVEGAADESADGDAHQSNGQPR